MKIRLFLTLLWIATAFTNAYPQQTAWEYFASYNDSQKTIIKKNWKQYFKEDIHTTLDSTIYMFPIKFDSYGGLYPDARLLENLRTDSDFNPRGRNAKNNLAFSMYDIFGADDQNKITNTLDKLKDEGTIEFYKMMLKSNHRIISFYREWNNFHFSRKIEELKETIRKRKCKRILFFALLSILRIQTSCM